MTALHPTPQTLRAVAFFTQQGLTHLLLRLREKYLELGKVGGQIVLEHTTPAERRDIAGFLGKPPYPSDTIVVKLAAVEQALKHSFDCTLPELLAAYFPDQPLVTRQEQRVERANQQAEFSAKLAAIAAMLPAGSRGKTWLEQGRHGQEWLFSRYKNLAPHEQAQQLALIAYIAAALGRLPTAAMPERLALFAQRTSGDPHALDPGRPAGRLLLLALSDLTNAHHQASGTASAALAVPQDRSQELRLYSEAGLLVDTISSNVAAYNLAGAIFRDGTRDALIQAAAQRVLLIPLRQLLEWQSIIPAGPHIYVFENPQVFEEVIAARETSHVRTAFTLACTSGWPSSAALILLDRLLTHSPDYSLHYSGDFDLKGLQIAAYLMARYPGRCCPWRFDPLSYTLALRSGGLPAPARELSLLAALPAPFAPLISAMQAEQKWAYQEGIADLLAADLIEWHYLP